MNSLTEEGPATEEEQKTQKEVEEAYAAYQGMLKTFAQSKTSQSQTRLARGFTR